MSDNSESTVENRSEIVFVYDAENANPNGNPMSAENEPRIDRESVRAVVTDVRLKRYLRDQLSDDGHGVYVFNPDDGSAMGRDELMERVLPDDLTEQLRANPEELDASVFDGFLENATDVRYFGATMSLKGDSSAADAANERLPDHFEGPVQFSPALSLNEVERNRESDSLTSVIATGDDKDTGGFGLSDNRIKYGIFPFHGIVNENAAENTKLTQDDVERLDTLCWRALKNQTLSRSKVGQQPRLYVRVEYEDDYFHIGDLHNTLALDEDECDEPLRSAADAAVDLTAFADTLNEHASGIDTVHVCVDSLLEYTVDSDTLTGADVVDALDAYVDADVRAIDVYEEYRETLA